MVIRVALLLLGAVLICAAQSTVTATGAGAEISVDGGATWGPLAVGTVVNPSNRLRAPASTTVRLERNTGCMNRFAVHWRVGGTVVHYVARFSSPANILFPGDYWEITEQDFTTDEGPMCTGTDHCGVIAPFAVAVPSETSPTGNTPYTVSHDSRSGCVLISNFPSAASSLATWAIVGPAPASQLNFLAPGQTGIYRADGSFSRFLPGDANGDGVLNSSDAAAIFAARNTRTTLCDARDADGDGVITVNDVRVVVTQQQDKRCEYTLGALQRVENCQQCPALTGTNFCSREFCKKISDCLGNAFGTVNVGCPNPTDVFRSSACVYAVTATKCVACTP